MCHVLGVSRSSFYTWRTRPECRRNRENGRLLAEIQRIHRGEGKVYGSPRVCKELRAIGFDCSENRIARLMRAHKIRARLEKRFRRPVLKGAPSWIAPNILNGKFQAERINQVWVADITYIETRKGWLYLAVVIDLFSRRVVGWSMSKRITSRLSLTALEMALAVRRPNERALLHHSDRGIHYSCNAYQERLRASGITMSMSRKGNCFDNAVAESFFGSLKMERVYRQTYSTRNEAKQDLFAYIEIFYNRKRRHSSLGYVSPIDYEATFRQVSLFSVSTKMGELQGVSTAS